MSSWGCSVYWLGMQGTMASNCYLQRRNSNRDHEQIQVYIEQLLEHNAWNPADEDIDTILIL